MDYKDALGQTFNVGDRVAYSVINGELQIGRILALTTQNVQDFSKKPLPRKFLTCAEYKFCADYGAACISKDKHLRGRVKHPTMKIPAIKVQGARRGYRGDNFEKLNPSMLTKFKNVIVINSNLVATITLI